MIPFIVYEFKKVQSYLCVVTKQVIFEKHEPRFSEKSEKPTVLTFFSQNTEKIKRVNVFKNIEFILMKSLNIVKILGKISRHVIANSRPLRSNAFSFF